MTTGIEITSMVILGLIAAFAVGYIAGAIFQDVRLRSTFEELGRQQSTLLQQQIQTKGILEAAMRFCREANTENLRELKVQVNGWRNN